MEKITVPDHYAKGNKQPIDFMRECMSDEAYEGFIVGNCVKYLMRYNYKDGIKDLYKCLDYVQKLIAFKEETNNSNTEQIAFGDSTTTGIISERTQQQLEEPTAASSKKISKKSVDDGLF